MTIDQDQRERAAYRDPDDAERQQNQPHDWIDDQGRNRNRPAHDKQDAPHQKCEHCVGSQQYNTKVFWKSSVIFVGILAGCLSAQTPLPKFEDFPVKEIFKGTPAGPILTTEHQRMYRTMIGIAARKGAKFAGHYTFAAAGCGSDCSMNALIDVQTGSVYDAPFKYVSFPPIFVYRDAGADPIVSDFRISSRLLIVHGCPEEKDCGTHFYEWTGSEFKHLLKLPTMPRKLN